MAWYWWVVIVVGIIILLRICGIKVFEGIADAIIVTMEEVDTTNV